jgi:hypothetical protein
VNRPRYAAVLRRTQQEVGDPQAALLDVKARLQSSESYFASATYLIDPAGLKQCIFELPEGLRLVHADIDRRAVSPTPLADHRYAFPLEQARRPIGLSIWCVGPVTRDAAGNAALEAPRLLDVPVRQTLWTVLSAVPEAEIALNENHISLQRRDELRRQALADLAEAVSGAGSEETDPAADNESGLDFWPQSSGVRCAAWQGVANSVSLHVSASSPSREPERAITAALAVLAACGLAWGLRRSHESEWLARFTPLTLAAGGIAWWIWLQPGLIGLAIAATGVWLSLGRPNRRAYSLPQS